MYEPVSGKGTVYSATLMTSGARHAYFEAAQPYVVGVVELDEQEGLLMYSNFPGARLDELTVGAPVEVFFQRVWPDDLSLPQFRLVAAS